MTANSHNNDRRSRAASTLPDAGESRGAVALTVAWMLTCMSTAVALLVVVAARLLLAAVPAEARDAHPLATVGGVILMVAMTTGTLCLLLTPLAYRVRRSPPPQQITIAAVIIGVAPLVTFAILSMR